MKQLKLSSLATVFLTAIVAATSAAAQTTAPSAAMAGDQSASNAEMPRDVSADTSQSAGDSVSSGASTNDYVPALNGSGLISLGDAVKSHLFVGAGYSGGWDSNPDSQANGAASGAFAFSPYAGLQIIAGKTRSMFQYQPTIQKFTQQQYSGGTLHLASAQVLGQITERWRWDFNASGDYGQDSIRLLAPQQTQAVGNVPGTQPNASAFLPNAGKLTYLNGEAGLHYDASERDSFELQFSNAYSKYSGMQETSGIATPVLNYRRSISPTLSIMTYGQTSYYYESIHCFSSGFGAGLNWAPSDNTSISANGGPQINSKACGKQQGFAYSAALNTRLTEQSQVYFTASRQTSATYLGPGLWQQTVAAGYQRRLGHARTMSADIGYTSSNSLQGVSSYAGTYVDGVFNQHLGSALVASVIYRTYSGNWGATDFSRNIVLFSLSWTPGIGHLFQ
jgi:hypothetical protein